MTTREHRMVIGEKGTGFKGLTGAGSPRGWQSRYFNSLAMRLRAFRVCSVPALPDGGRTVRDPRCDIRSAQALSRVLLRGKRQHTPLWHEHVWEEELRSRISCLPGRYPTDLRKTPLRSQI